MRFLRLSSVFVSLTLLFAFGIEALASESDIKAPNVVVISQRLVTSGQPSAEALSLLGAQGFGAVIYLAPPTVSDAVPNEAEIVRKQGLVFVNIPIEFNNPNERDFEAFAASLIPLQGQKILIHCQVNARASSMVFLHRVLVGGEDPKIAYESVSKVWTPQGKWKRFITSMLQKQNVRFEPY